MQLERRFMNLILSVCLSQNARIICVQSDLCVKLFTRNYGFTFTSTTCFILYYLCKWLNQIKKTLLYVLRKANIFKKKITLHVWSFIILKVLLSFNHNLGYLIYTLQFYRDFYIYNIIYFNDLNEFYKMWSFLEITDLQRLWLRKSLFEV